LLIAFVIIFLSKKHVLKWNIYCCFSVRINTMRFIYLIAFTLFSFQSFANDTVFQGTWQGVIVKAGQSIDQGTVLYADFKLVDGVLTGNMREELYDTDVFALKIIEGTQEAGTLKYNQIVVSKKSQSSRAKWCRTKGELTYNETTGYMTGDFLSSDCKRLAGKIILFKADFELSTVEESHSSHLWFNQFRKDYKAGLNAPAIRKIERDNFVFEPIFFDFDKSEIRQEHDDFLNAMIKIVKGHSDIRIMVTGHTDAIGTDGYNVGLSKRRTESIIEYFVKHGINADRLEFDFKGETNPAATNDTSEGRQRNRRVDFKFI